MLSLLLLIGLSLILIFIVFAIKIDSKGPVIFKQERIGKDGKVFKIYKFRSMYVGAENKGSGVYSGKNDTRVTKVGRILRATSLDELPQTINILKGDMSLVGTRPPTLDEYQHYEIRHKVRLSIKPGLTGLWQVSGRNRITDFEEIVKLDEKYIENWSLKEDMKIIMKTVKVVLARKGAE